MHTVIGKVQLYCGVCSNYRIHQQFPSPNGQGTDEQCLAYPFSNGKNMVRVKVECITEQANKKAYFEPRYIFTVLISNPYLLFTDKVYMDCLAGV